MGRCVCSLEIETVSSARNSLPAQGTNCASKTLFFKNFFSTFSSTERGSTHEQTKIRHKHSPVPWRPQSIRANEHFTSRTSKHVA